MCREPCWTAPGTGGGGTCRAPVFDILPTTPLRGSLVQENGTPRSKGIPTCGLRWEPRCSEYGQRRLFGDVVQLIEHVAWRPQIMDAICVVDEALVQAGDCSKRHGRHPLSLHSRAERARAAGTCLRGSSAQASDQSRRSGIACRDWPPPWLRRHVCGHAQAAVRKLARCRCLIIPS